MSVKKKLFRYAASLILVTRDGYQYPRINADQLRQKVAQLRQQTTCHPANRLAGLHPYMMHRGAVDHVRDVEVLFVQRTTEAGFMPDSHVFPGGVLDEADCSLEWLDLFAPLTTDSLRNSLAAKPAAERLPLYSSLPTGSVIGELAFRICAIRETFEETGILVARGHPLEHLLIGTERPSCHVLPCEQLEAWRTRVCEDANSFRQLFREMGCVPDVWSLVEWSNWLTPENMRRRYDTAFYMCCLDNRPQPTHNPSEVSKAEWLMVSDALGRHRSQLITLPPPQVAELSQINLFPSLSHLHHYATYQSLYGCRVCYLPRRVMVQFTDNHDNMLVSLLPGDDLYPVRDDLYPVRDDLYPEKGFHCSNEVFREALPLTRCTDNALYEFTASARTGSDLITDNMLRMTLEDSHRICHVDTIHTPQLAHLLHCMEQLQCKL